MIYPQEAIKQADRLYRKFGTRDPASIAGKLGIWIIPEPFRRQKGVYTVIKRQPIIFIKDSLGPVMNSIVTAHELGHHILHHREAAEHGFREFNLFDMSANRMEYEANLFAAQLMLPDDQILEYIYKKYDTAQIARAMNSDINLVALKVSEMNRQGYRFCEQEHNNKFLK